MSLCLTVVAQQNLQTAEQATTPTQLLQFNVQQSYQAQKQTYTPLPTQLSSGQSSGKTVSRTVTDARLAPSIRRVGSTHGMCHRAFGTTIGASECMGTRESEKCGLGALRCNVRLSRTERSDRRALGRPCHCIPLPSTRTCCHGSSVHLRTQALIVTLH